MPTPEPEVLPQIQDEEGKSGWEAISDVIEATIEAATEAAEETEETEASEKGAVVTIDMNGTAKVPTDIFTLIADKDISVEFVLEDGLKWTVNGRNVSVEEQQEIDFTVTLATEDEPLENIPAELIDEVTGEHDSIEMNLAYSGEFGFEAVLTVDLDKKNAGAYANLFFYNPETKELVFICADVIAEDGNAELTFTHASDYLIVLSEETLEPVTEIIYTVVKGDTLYKIAGMYECTVQEIVDANKDLIQDPALIHTGWKLKIPVEGAKDAEETDAPKPQDTPAAPAEDKKYGVYVVKKDDTLWMISQKCGCTVQELMELNRELIQNADMIHIGWELTVPEK